MIQAVLMALWQCEEQAPATTHSDRGCQFTSVEYQRFLARHNLICSMSAVGGCAHNAAAEGRADILDYIDRFNNPRRRRQFEMLYGKDFPSTQPSVETG